jgi:hypothetical protein
LATVFAPVSTFAPRVRFLDSTAFRKRKSAGPGYLALHKIVAQGLETA